MRSLFFIFCLTAFFNPAHAQRALVTKTGSIKFTSAKNADVNAINRQVSAVITDTGKYRLCIIDQGIQVSIG